MLKNYVKVGFRNLLKYRFYSIINVLGLTVGLTCSALIGFYIQDELSYDKFHDDYEKIYRIGISGKLAGQTFDAAVACAPMAETIATEFPEVESSIRLVDWENVLMTYEEKSFIEETILLADSNFFQFWNYDLLEGDASTALTGTNKIVISENSAIKFFDWQGPGDTSPIGKIMKFSTGDRTVEVTGIVENAPSNSHIKFDMIFSMVSWQGSFSPQWVSNNFYTYFKKNPDVPIAQTEENLEGLVEKYVAPQLEQALGKTMEEFRANGDYYGYFTQALPDIHFDSSSEAEMKPGSDIQYIYVLSAVALFILLLASINFMNLSTARSANRAKEVGIRKTVGGTKSGLSIQFMVESLLISIISVLPSLVLVYAFLSPFNDIAGKEISTEIFTQPFLYLGVLGLALIIGLLAGIYPAIYLTSFRPVEVLKGSLSKGMKSSGVRSFLVIFQFFISIVLIICTLLVFKQLDMLQNKHLGFDKENIMIIENARALGNQKLSFRNELMQYDEIASASISQSVPPYISNNTVFIPEGDNQEYLWFMYLADEYHAQTMGYQVDMGRFFSEEYKSDSMALIVNEAAMKQIQWKDIENKRIKTHFYSEQGEMCNLVGVVKDFNFESLKQTVRPMAFRYNTEGNILTVRLTKGNIADKVAFVEQKWKDATNGGMFEYSFVDQEFNAQFEAEQRLSELSMIFTGVAIFVACLGLFALATFTSEQRSKEIGVRKVMGASNKKIVTLLTKEFTKLVIISFILAVPAGYYLMDGWLQSFPYKTDINVMTFVISGLGALLIAFLTVGYQSYKAAAANPVKSIRTE